MLNSSEWDHFIEDTIGHNENLHNCKTKTVTWEKEIAKIGHLNCMRLISDDKTKIPEYKYINIKCKCKTKSKWKDTYLVIVAKTTNLINPKTYIHYMTIFFTKKQAYAGDRQPL